MRATTSVPVDPRIQARRRDVKRNAGRRRFRIMMGLLSFTTVVAAGYLLAGSPLFDVDQVAVVGIVNADPSEVVEVSGIERGTPLHSLDTESGEEALRALPWVSEASISRSVGGEVEIGLVERTPVAMLPAPEGAVLVDAGGRQLDTREFWSPEYLRVAGIETSGQAGEPIPAVAHSVLRMVEQLVPPVAERIAQVTVEGADLYLELVDGGRVRIGDDASMYEKMVAVETMLTRVDLRCLDEIDVRVPSAPALTRVTKHGDPLTPEGDLAHCE